MRFLWSRLSSSGSVAKWITFIVLLFFISYEIKKMKSIETGTWTHREHHLLFIWNVVSRWSSVYGKYYIRGAKSLSFAHNLPLGVLRVCRWHFSDRLPIARDGKCNRNEDNNGNVTGTVPQHKHHHNTFNVTIKKQLQQWHALSLYISGMEL